MEFKIAANDQKKEFIGNVVYKYVEKIIGPQYAPKITGMIIDLPLTELNKSVMNLNTLAQKV